jgi:transposase
MARQSREPLRELTNEERQALQKLARSRSEAAEVVGRAKSLLAVAEGASFAAGARAGGRKSGYGVGKLVARFNREGLAVLQTKPSTGRPITYTSEQRAQVLAEYRRTPDREVDGTGTWSLTTLQRAVRGRPGLARMSRDTISGILHGAGLTWQRDRTWCDTGLAVRKTQRGKRVVEDVDTESKKS